MFEKDIMLGVKCKYTDLYSHLLPPLPTPEFFYWHVWGQIHELFTISNSYGKIHLFFETI